MIIQICLIRIPTKNGFQSYSSTMLVCIPPFPRASYCLAFFFLDYFNPDSIRGARTNLSQSIIYICYEGELIFHIFMNIEHWTMNNGALALLCCIELKFVRLRAQTGGYIKLYTIPLRGRTIFYLYFIGLCVCECTCGTVQWKLLTVKVLAIQIRI